MIVEVLKMFAFIWICIVCMTALLSTLLIGIKVIKLSLNFMLDIDKYY